MNPFFDERRYLIPFRTALLPQIFTDVIVVGAGVAGLRAALAAADAGKDVIVAAKGGLKHSNTYWAQGGVAAVLDQARRLGDSFESHIEDTLDAGADLCDTPTVKRVVEEAPERIRELIDWGMAFDRSSKAVPTETSRKMPGSAVHGGEDLALGREGGHSFSRILHADGDATGKALSETLERRVLEHDNIRVFYNCFVIDLVTLDGQPTRCVGAVTHHTKYGLQVIWSRATILATGGAGQVYRETTNPNVATGDGLAMAYRAGAKIADMAFMQFHPTTLYIAGASRSLITEAVRGEGATLTDHDGHRFMHDYDRRGELAPRDIVSRAILAQMQKTNFSHVYLDATNIGTERFAQRFPGIFKLLQNFAIDPGVKPIPIHPAAHYMVGGVLTDEVGRTNIRGLYAAGEVACTGLHGANRLASNSLLEGLVFGEAVGRVCDEMFESNGDGAPVTGMQAKVVSDIRPSERAELDIADVRSSLRSIMWRHVGIERDGRHLAEVSEMFDFWARYSLDKIFDDQAAWEVQNMLLIGALITRACRWREESRGTHYRLDHPTSKEAFHLHDVWSRGYSEPDTNPIMTSTTASNDDSA